MKEKWNSVDKAKEEIANKSDERLIEKVPQGRMKDWVQDSMEDAYFTLHSYFAGNWAAKAFGSGTFIYIFLCLKVTNTLVVW